MGQSIQEPNPYPQRDKEALGAYYFKHIGAMTQFGLFSKSDIAAELAIRDQRIEELERQLGQNRDKSTPANTKSPSITELDVRDRLQFTTVRIRPDLDREYIIWLKGQNKRPRPKEQFPEFFARIMTKGWAFKGLTSGAIGKAQETFKKAASVYFQDR